jgi:hypothetical protein
MYYVIVDKLMKVVNQNLAAICVECIHIFVLKVLLCALVVFLHCFAAFFPVCKLPVMRVSGSRIFSCCFSGM